MSRIECPLEQETLAMVQSGRWPHGCDEASRISRTLTGIVGTLLLVESLLPQRFSAGGEGAEGG